MSKSLTSVCFIFFNLIVIGFFFNKFAAIKNISLYLLIILTSYFIIKNKISIPHALNILFNQRKVFFVFNLWCLICILFFTYSNFTYQAFLLFCSDWKYAIGLTLFLIVFYQQVEKIKQSINYSMLFALIITICLFPFLLDTKNDSRPIFIILRSDVSIFIPFLFPFALGFLFSKYTKLIKVILSLFIMFVFLFVIYTGFRSVLLAIILETIIIFYFNLNLKRFLFVSFSFFIVLGLICSAGYYAIPQIKQKIDQTIQNKNISSSRDLIINSRFPIIMNTLQNKITGIGYGSVSYNQYFLDNNALKAGGIGRYTKNGVYEYNNDEPFLLNILYNVGIVGLILFLTALFIDFKNIYKNLKQSKDAFNISLLAAGIGYFLIYCSFEFIYMRIFILFSILSVLCIITPSSKQSSKRKN